MAVKAHPDICGCQICAPPGSPYIAEYADINFSEYARTAEFDEIISGTAEQLGRAAADEINRTCLSWHPLHV